jgi:hypothetical protein
LIFLSCNKKGIIDEGENEDFDIIFIKKFLKNWIYEKHLSTPCFICLPQGIGGKLFDIMHYEIVNGFFSININGFDLLFIQ